MLIDPLICVFIISQEKMESKISSNSQKINLLQFANKLLPPFLKHKINSLSSKIDTVGIIFKYIEPADWISAIFRYKVKPAVIYLNDNLGMMNVQDLISIVKKHRRERVRRSHYRWEKNGKSLVGNLRHFFNMQEYFTKIFEDIYAYNWKGKTVLDLGGYIGDSARFFLENEASKIHVYEPISFNLEAMQHNLKEFTDKVVIYPIALSDKSGTITISSNEPLGSLGFGISSLGVSKRKGVYSLECVAETLQEILAKESFDVAKVDIEGSEEYLCLASPKLLQSVPCWMVETHSHEIEDRIKSKFLECGFCILRTIKLSDVVSLHHFQRTL